MNNIDILKELVDDVKKYGFETKIDGEEHLYLNYKAYKAIEHLISYVKKLEEINQSHKELNGELREEVKKLEDDLYAANNIISDQIDLLKDSIPKEKAREKIKEANKEIKQMEKDDIGIGFTLGNRWSDLKAKVKGWEELLQEER